MTSPTNTADSCAAHLKNLRSVFSTKSDYLLTLFFYRKLVIQMGVLLLDLLDLRALLGLERWQSANKGLPLGSVEDRLGSIGGVEASRIEVVFD